MKLTDFSEAEKYLESLIPKDFQASKALRLERIELLLNKLGNPEKSLNFIHIGGTAGKGSTAILLSQILTGQYLKIGLHISPHLQTLRERIQINGKNISEEDFVKLINEIEPAITQVAETPFGSPTYFEALVAASFFYFEKQKMDLAVVEVGLGGTLDATNVITPLISILTNVGLDHTEILGNTVEKIARDKVGIFKPNVPVITGVTQPSVRKIVAKKAQETASKVLLLGGDFNFSIKQKYSQKVFDFIFKEKKLANLEIGAAGKFQINNASLALASLFVLEEQNLVKINEAKLRESLLKTKVPGRFEEILTIPLTILDGAHNPMKMAALGESLNTIGNKFVFLLSFKQGKNIGEMLKIIEPRAKKIVITQFSSTTDMGKSLATPVLEVDRLIQKSNSLLIPDPKKAFSEAKNLALKESLPLIVTGSLYLVGEIRSFLGL